jgi:hypothetical protein
LNRTNVVTIRRPTTAPRQLGCSACGATTEATCDCGAPYLPASQRAAEAIAANPERSDRAIAAEIGVGKNTVMRARQSAGPDGPPEKRIGQDGKSYPAKATKPAFSKKEEAERERGSFMLRAQEAKNFAFYNGKADQKLVEFARRTAAAWSELANKLGHTKASTKSPEVKNKELNGFCNDALEFVADFNHRFQVWQLENKGIGAGEKDALVSAIQFCANGMSQLAMTLR